MHRSCLQLRSLLLVAVAVANASAAPLPDAPAPGFALPVSAASTSVPRPAAPAAPSPSDTFVLQPSIEVDGRGIFLAHLGSRGDGRGLPAVRLQASPAVGASVVLTRARIQEMLGAPELGLSFANWTGADRVLVTRRLRKFDDAELLPLLTKALQDRCVRDRGELELKLSRPWSTVSVPDEPLSLRLVDVPASGLGALNIVRFEVLAGAESAGTWQAVVQAKVWREIWIARNGLRRGQEITEADLGLERRDVLVLREALADPGATTRALQAADAVQAGAPVLQRHLRLLPVIHRGQAVTVVLSDGLLELVMKAEALEDGAPGQIVRLRNLTSRREIRGKVQDEKTVIPIL